MREIHYEVSDGIATVTIDRPDKRGAMTFAMLDEFTARIRQAGADDTVRVVVLTGAGGSFCAGIDLADLGGRSPDDRGVRPEDADSDDTAAAILRCPKPVVAAVDGMAIGMGAEFATQADLRVLSSRARFRWSFVRLGLVADTGAGTWLLPRHLGVGRALHLLYTGEDLDAQTAFTLGFATAVVEPGELAATARRLARSIAEASPFAVARTKKLVLEGLGTDFPAHAAATRSALAECFASADHAEAVAAFLEKRPARFGG